MARAPGQSIKAFVVGRDGEMVDPERLREFCASSMPRHMLPGVIEILDELPKTSSGKVDYAALRRREEAARG
jgi:acyl-CoA synthetase (AMP-forming)/AMP-acid ligase II